MVKLQLNGAEYCVGYLTKSKELEYGAYVGEMDLCRSECREEVKELEKRKKAQK